MVVFFAVGYQANNKLEIGCFKNLKFVNNDIACANCDGPLAKLSLPFRNMLKEKLKSVGKDV